MLFGGGIWLGVLLLTAKAHALLLPTGVLLLLLPLDAGRRGAVVTGAHLGQRLVQAREQEVMHQSPVPEAHFVLGRVNVDIHHRRVELQIEHEHRMPTMEQHVAIGLTHGMRDEAVAHHAAIDEEVLLIGLGTRVRRQAHPTGQTQAGGLDIQMQRMLEEVAPEQRTDTPFHRQGVFTGTQLMHHLLVVTQGPADIVA